MTDSSALPSDPPRPVAGPLAEVIRESAGPAIRFEDEVPRPSPSRAAITATHRRPEPACIAALIDAATLPAEQAAAAHSLAARLAGQLRSRKVTSGREGLVQGLIQEFSLSSHEGVALMCLAEALLRIPDAATRDAPDPRQDRPGRLAGAPGAQPVAVRERRDLGPAADRQAGRDRTASKASPGVDVAARAQAASR